MYPCAGCCVSSKVLCIGDQHCDHDRLLRNWVLDRDGHADWDAADVGKRQAHLHAREEHLVLSHPRTAVIPRSSASDPTSSCEALLCVEAG